MNCMLIQFKCNTAGKKVECSGCFQGKQAKHIYKCRGTLSGDPSFIAHLALTSQRHNKLPAHSRLLTLALLAHCLVQGVAVKTLLAAFTVISLRVSQALQTAPSDVITYSHRVEVHITIAVASRTWLSCP